MGFSRYKFVLFHLLGVSFFVGYEIVILFIFGTPPTVRGYLAYALDIATFYLNFLWVVPQLFNPKSRLIFFLRLSSLIIAHVIIRNLITYWNATKVPVFDYLLTGKQVVLGIWRLIYILGVGFFLALIEERQRRQREQQELKLSVVTAEAENARVESLLFQMQLSPHLLFNTLTLIHAKARPVLPAIADAIGLLGDICRHSLIDIRNVRKISVGDEIREIENRIKLQECLDEATLCFVFKANIDERAEKLELPPSLLLTLTDNVIKYGVLNNPQLPARIGISVNGDSLSYNTWNEKAPGIRAGSGLGINSVQNILEYYYPGKYEMNITDQDDTYSLELKIEL